ncbi:hypothetical protein, partial [uncultured Nostoc sp.]|uniref:hypothetical protein n=1 Tax=uncultured Nostoc sp. TaxID=340711 RepID=UPI0035CA85A9
MTANIRMPLVNSEKNAQIGKVLKEVDTTSEIYQLFESNFNASDRKLHNLKLGNGEWGMEKRQRGGGQGENSSP